MLAKYDAAVAGLFREAFNLLCAETNIATRSRLCSCQFLVREGGNYEVHATHADARVEWSQVEQVRVFSFKELACPICLGEPEAARITKCVSSLHLKSARPAMAASRVH